MNIKFLYTSIACLALSAGAVTAADDKTLGEKTSDAAGKVVEKTKDVTRAAVDATKDAAAAVKDAVTPDSDARKIEVTLSDHQIDMARSIPAGKTAFVVKNNGKAKHNFEIEGQGIEKQFLANVGPGDTKTLHVDLKPGNYKVYCPVKDHEAKGMELTLMVK